jgi:hypothetical protein
MGASADASQIHLFPERIPRGLLKIPPIKTELQLHFRKMAYPRKKHIRLQETPEAAQMSLLRSALSTDAALLGPIH